MTYKLIKTDGSLLTEIADGSIDQSATDLTLIGKNVSGYGEFLNENFIKLLENFASTAEPNNPQVGQIWFDVGTNRIRVYDGTSFRTGSGPVVQGSTPVNLVQGDLWIDSKENQLYFYDGTDLTLAGPIFKQSQGYSGFETVTIFDTNSIERTIVKLWVSETLLGIFSKDSIPFTPLVEIQGFSGDIGPGFNKSNLSNITFDVNATTANALVDSQGTTYSPSSFVSTQGNSATIGTLSIQNERPLILGPSSDFEIRVDGTTAQLVSNANGQDYIIKTKVQAGYSNAVVIKSVSNRVGVFNSEPQAMLHVGTEAVPGDVIIEGNLTVNGTTTTINTAELAIEDVNITLANTAVPSDTIANGGGITIKGTTDKTITWNSSRSSAPYNIDLPAFNINQNINLADGSGYYMGGVPLFASNTSLAGTITSAPGLTTIGTLSSISIGNIGIQNNRLRATNTNGDLELSANGLGRISLIGTPRIIGMGAPQADNDAANKYYVDTTVNSRPVFLSLDITGLSDNQVALVLNDVAPVAYFSTGTFARVHCTKQVVTYPSVTIVPALGQIAVDKGGVQNSVNVVQTVTISNANIGTGTIGVQRSIKVFRVTTGTWVYDSVQTAAAQSASQVPALT